MGWQTPPTEKVAVIITTFANEEFVLDLANTQLSTQAQNVAVKPEKQRFPKPLGTRLSL